MSARLRPEYSCCHAPVVGGVDPQHKCNFKGRGGGKSADTAEASKERSATGRVQGRVDAPRAAHPAPSKPAGRAAEDALAEQLALSGFNVLTWGEWLMWALHGMACESSAVVREARWGQALVPERRFRSDFLIPSARLLVEIDGRIHHVVAKQGRVDVLRAQLAQQAGYRILRVLPEQCADRSALAIVRAAWGV